LEPWTFSRSRSIPKLFNSSAKRFLSDKKSGPQQPVGELVHLAELARERKAFSEARTYLKIAMTRDVSQPEPYYQLGELCEDEGRVSHAVDYYYMALEAQPTFEPARAALKRLGHLDSRTDV
jgi:hypothetical protein